MPSTDKSGLARLRDALIFFVGAVLFLFIFHFTTIGITQWWNSLNATPAPIIDTPQINTQTVNLIEEPYQVPQAPFAQNNYDQAPRIIYRGSFSKIVLNSTGSLAGQGQNFFMFNFNNQTGIIGGKRTAINKINPEDDKNSVINSDNTFSISLDLMNAQLGTSSKDFEATGGAGTKDFHFISSEEEANSAKILLAPFGQNGQYNGVIASLNIEYSCSSEDEKCEIQKCNAGEKTTACISRLFTAKEAAAWQKKAGL